MGVVGGISDRRSKPFQILPSCASGEAVALRKSYGKGLAKKPSGTFVTEIETGLFGVDEIPFPSIG